MSYATIYRCKITQPGGTVVDGCGRETTLDQLGGSSKCQCGGSFRDTGRPAASSTGLDLLQAWIGRDPTFRVVERMARRGDKLVVELRSKSGLHESNTQETFDSAIRTVLMIAMNEGER